MKNIVRLAAALALVAGAVWLWAVLFPPPEKIIAGQLEKIARAASTAPVEGTLPRLLAAQKIGATCASNVDISIDLPHHHQHAALTRDEIVQGLAAANTSGGLSIKFQDINVTVSGDGSSAQADLTVQGKITGESDLIVQQMKFTLRKIDRKWLITKVQTVRPLS